TVNTSESNSITIKGNWELAKTELFENGKLAGSTNKKSSSTQYHFKPNGESETTGLLKIDDEGESEELTYQFDIKNQLLNIGNNNQYQIEKITPELLIFYKEYGPYKSRYQLQKVK
ncbi:hypothetical protein N8987_06195, partial [Crocinitomix sp.]|nr:hypothetical protein [Crocinitomix sp.]